MIQLNPIEIKGSIFTLLVLYIKHHQEHVVQHAILQKMKEFPNFFKHAPVVLNVSFLSHHVNWKNMQQSILSTGLHIVGISGCVNQLLKNTIMQSGLPILSEGKHFVQNKRYFEKCDDSVNKIFNTKIINTPIRSGQSINVHQSDLIVTNHVSAGAELLADGNIHIYGMMRGRVLAGVNGDKTRNIFCTNLFAELVSIAGKYLLIDQIPIELLGKGVHIFLKNNILLFYPLM